MEGDHDRTLPNLDKLRVKEGCCSLSREEELD